MEHVYNGNGLVSMSSADNFIAYTRAWNVNYLPSPYHGLYRYNVQFESLAERRAVADEERTGGGMQTFRKQSLRDIGKTYKFQSV